jgi:hypothetical protein
MAHPFIERAFGIMAHPFIEKAFMLLPIDPIQLPRSHEASVLGWYPIPTPGPCRDQRSSPFDRDALPR